ncbi:hypothetical protein [Pseudoalteromonas luteoviolacea]|uniref:Cytochrome b561 bacterial/Ni-hydrogenase domain-containing protein n=1 Tax=Pseudoalteromonas luteoviolacea NCIMB 1942 TaxID=1365253 RepID=A0A167GM93_9GAMM|nr:hypothetical protein [Pseudoalteromonas luteoviolacea]KZN55817.1 hypothetical protein N482_04905 [Pseudoalteromonas luteoviolacea NCIMB 1942]
MVVNAEVAIQLFGVQLSDIVNNDGRFYSKLLDVYLQLIFILWCLIAFHFAGVFYARR